MSRRRKDGDRHSHLSEDDQEIWEHTARSLAPLKRSKSRVHAKASMPGETSAPTPPSGSATRDDESKPELAPRSTSKAHPKPTKSSPQRPDPGPAPFDPRNARKLRRGHIEIDGRIDLHGMRQAEAHMALRAFLRSSHAQGKRWVLVITGKGMTTGPRAEHGWGGDNDRGVLRRNVPLWLEEPEVRGLVVSYSQAAVEHGGSGALYVHLRRADRIAHR